LKGQIVQKMMSAVLLCILAGCAGSPSQGYPVCATQPGTYACQVEQYHNVDN
jgi:hypothetical protein